MAGQGVTGDEELRQRHCADMAGMAAELTKDAETLRLERISGAVESASKAVAALKNASDGKAVVAKMKELPTEDSLFGKGTIRADGRKIHDMYLFEVKKPSESKGPWDYYKLRATIPAAEAFRPLKEGNCPLVSG